MTGNKTLAQLSVNREFNPEICKKEIHDYLDSLTVENQRIFGKQRFLGS